MFFVKVMEALKTATKEPLYEESKGCTKEWTVYLVICSLADDAKSSIRLV